jgi:hypothetical protein
MTDTPVKKGFLNSIHAAVKWLFHIILIPVVALLKALEAGIAYLVTELSKV